MRILESYGRKIVCDHYFGAIEIESGSKWQSCTGCIVIVLNINNGIIKYSHDDCCTHIEQSDLVTFQSSYSKII
jgi:hypothetical protein